ncbi:PREDICTED: centrosomal protein of 83 kDa-like [Branchiostoma belcheri]|uniref:Centrosomal protein of 83 kDa-like n=1 Tax=Branchiostoma belcheri TaxID=7741 RepID=A0A6P4ZR86_BRABE|nr:PREDICTED: centrosomal protein of 83 kDa-like [Branchiostoma belcheri]
MASQFDSGAFDGGLGAPLGMGISGGPSLGYGDLSGTHGAALPRLASETELQKMLTDEKMRSEQHKTNYETLKAEHTRLQDEHILLQEQLRGLRESHTSVQAECQTLIAQARLEVSQKIALIEELKSQVMSSQRLEMIRVQVREEVEGPYRERISKLDGELDKLRTEMNQLRYEHSFLKSEYEHQQTEHKRIVEETTLKYEAEIMDLRKDREAILARQQEEEDHDSQRVRTLQKENAQLHLKVKGLLTELEEIRAQRESSGMQSDHVSRLQAKQLAETTASLRAAESEKQSLKMRCERLQQDLDAALDQQSKLSSQLGDVQREHMAIRHKYDEISHKHKLEVTNMKMETVKRTGELERERDQLRSETEGIRTQLEVLQQTIERQSAELADKERELVRRVQAARDEEGEKLIKLQTEQMEMDAKMAEMERQRLEDESTKMAERERAEEKVNEAMRRKDAAEREVQELNSRPREIQPTVTTVTIPSIERWSFSLCISRGRVQQQQSIQREAETERANNSELRQRLQEAQAQLRNMSGAEHDLAAENRSLKQAVDRLKDELRAAREAADKAQTEATKGVNEKRLAWLEERQALERRVEDLERELQAQSQKLDQSVQYQRKLKKNCSRVVQKLKSRLKIVDARREEAVLERDKLKGNVPVETYNRLRKQFRDFIRKHKEFSMIVAGTGGLHEISIGGLSFASATLPLDTSLPYVSFIEQERQHHKELSMVRQRLDELDDLQKQQMDVLTGQGPPPRDEEEEKKDGERAFIDVDNLEL